MSASAIVQSVHYVSSCGTGAGDVSLLRFGKYISLFCAVADAVTSVGVAIFVHRTWLRPRSQGFIQTNRHSMDKPVSPGPECFRVYVRLKMHAILVCRFVPTTSLSTPLFSHLTLFRLNLIFSFAELDICGAVGLVSWRPSILSVTVIHAALATTRHCCGCYAQ